MLRRNLLPVVASLIIAVIIIIVILFLHAPPLRANWPATSLPFFPLFVLAVTLDFVFAFSVSKTTNLFFFSTLFPHFKLTKAEKARSLPLPKPRA